MSPLACGQVGTEDPETCALLRDYYQLVLGSISFKYFIVYDDIFPPPLLCKADIGNI